MYILKPVEAQRRYLDELAEAFPEWFKPEPDDYDRKVMITIERADSYVKVEIVSLPPRLPVVIKPGGIVLVEGQGVESGEKKILVHSIVSDLIAAIDVISPRDKEFIAFHPTAQQQQ
ncbi:MAG: hypothetical protein ACN4GR_10985 [Arenicellales bacterium]